MKYVAVYAVCLFISACTSPPAAIDRPIFPPGQGNVPAPEETRVDAENDRERSIVRKEAEVDEMLRRYAAYPRRTVVSARTKDSPFASYTLAWRKEVEDLGSRKFPKGTNGKPLYGSVLLSIEVDRKGHLVDVNVERTSGNEALDKAAKSIVQMASPFQPLPPETARETDILVIVETFSFHNVPDEPTKRKATARKDK